MLLLLAAGIPAAAAQEPAPSPASDLTFVLILSRHGVRSPLLRNEEMARFAADPWPQWEVPAGILTPHGRKVMELMGAYYRAYYASQGLLSGDPAVDSSRIFIRADGNQRTIESARALGEGLLPGKSVVIHALAVNRPPENGSDHTGDPLLDPDTPVLRSDSGLRTASVLGRIGGDYGLLLEENRPALEALERVVLGGDGTPPPGKVSLFSLPPGGALWTDAQRMVDAIALEYADGKPLADVGWGRIRPADLPPLLSLSSLVFDLNLRTRFRAQASASNLADHILSTLEQAATGQAVDGALGTPRDRLALVVGHDSNIIPLGGLLNVGWRLPGASFNPVLPGGAMIFELRRMRANGRFVVRTRYVAPTYAQTRAAVPLTLENPPAAAPIFVPECSVASPGYDAPLELFAAHLRAAINPSLVEPEPAGVR
jgi:4-phytase/acid phosphatase